MEVKGNHNFKVSREQLWTYLMDPIVLAKITPGVSRLETLGEDQFKSVSEIKIGPVKASFTGKLKVVDKNQPASFVIKMEQLSRIGNAHVSVQMNIDEKEGGIAALAFDGKANLSGVIARTGQRVLSGVANVITKEVFSALEKHIEENRQTIKSEEPIQSEDTIKPPESKDSTDPEINPIS
ncbi:MAG: CoxG family protein [Saprospiraceae bacterium]